MFTIDLAFDRPTKRTVRFRHDDFGTVYVPNDVYEQLGHPETLKLTLEPEHAPELAQAA